MRLRQGRLLQADPLADKLLAVFIQLIHFGRRFNFSVYPAVLIFTVNFGMYSVSTHKDDNLCMPALSSGAGAYAEISEGGVGTDGEFPRKFAIAPMK